MLIDARHAIRAAENDFIAERMGLDALNAALQSARRDRGDIVDESLRGDFDQLGRHVAADRDQMVAVVRERSAEHPVVVRLVETRTCSPVSASIARTDLSVQPKATRLPSGDQETPKTSSFVTGTESSSLCSATSQICTSPVRPGRPPVTASFVPSGEKRTESIRSAMPTSNRATSPAAIRFVQQHFVEAGDGQAVRRWATNRAT